MIDWTKEPISIIRRRELPEIRSIVIGGAEHSLGIHKDFRKSEVLARFIPEDARLALAWVHLGPGERLDPHQHPIETMIVMCQGTGRMLGELETEVAEGDVVVIPRGKQHGFVGTGAGYWALSVQFEARGLYEKPGAALVDFDGYADLVRRNEQFMEDFKSNEVFALVEGGEVENKAVRAKLLDTIQIWSRHFQRVVMSRVVFGSNPRFDAIAREHLAEEYGHDTNLEQSRGGALRPVWDPLLEACSAWFPAKMLSLDDVEKTVLVHLVLEGSSTVFHRVAHPIMDAFNETKHFAVHDTEDGDHLAMGLDLLRGLDHETYVRLGRILREGWDMMNALNTRMAILAREAGAA